MTAAATDTAPVVVVSKFSSLFVSEVAEVITTSVDAWLDHFLVAPTETWSGEGHGGWSPVEYEPSKRSRANVKRVHALVLDYDKGADWSKLTEYWREFSATLYTTKSHAGDAAARLRVVLALTRSVTADEYARLWEWGAKASPCAADPQAKDPSRFWYDPTLPPGGWRAERFRGATIDPDAVISATPKRTHAPSLPLPVSSDQRVRRARAWIEKVPGAVSGKGGHVATFNAVASVLIGFDVDPEQARPIIDEWNRRCDPPWSAHDLDHKFTSVLQTCRRDRGYMLRDRPTYGGTASAGALTGASAPAPDAPDAPDDAPNWLSLLLTKTDGTARKGLTNVEVFVRHHPDYRGRWSVNEMDGTAHLDGEPVDDVVMHDVRSSAEKILGFCPSREDVASAVMRACHDRKFHPVRDYLRSVEWDGITRLREMARDYLGSDDPQHGELVYRWMISAVARVMRPGCKVDTSLMLVGAQGAGKSTFFAILGGKYHRDTFLDITNKDAFGQLHAAWLYELSELETVVGQRAESRFKAFISSPADSYRPPYARTIETRPRSVVLCGSTNRREFLSDDTGSRRFWVVPVSKAVDVATLRECRDQLWAEAVACFEAGERWWLDREAEDALQERNLEFHEQDPWTDKVAGYLAGLGLSPTSIPDVLENGLEVDVARQGRAEQMRVSRILKQLGWNRLREQTRDGRRRWVYRKC